MGISGLLPALKSIQTTKHLSEFAGQTLAVDAYVWLHRGVLTCATELATGKPTHKYVNYAMHRVRLLRHHGIEPYIVFDGGPLPAKKGTETDRKKKREESLRRGNALAAQGKHSEAREHYTKCVDVTPQMAYQFIKALRAESVFYIVAPYEADAQMAYLERVGIVDGIITEDSDLLVFGCCNVLFKLDIVTSTGVSIRRKDFGSVSGSGSDVSLVGWSDVEFRAMAILSGCDYLPSIPGVGLKTACNLLRKWKTVEQVVRVIQLEGKKPVPRRYLQNFKLAEKCFLHQRVYCPKQEKLVYLTDVDSDWDDEAEAYVGSDLEPSIAKSLATGEIDPITLLQMKDVNPGFVPRARPAPLALKEINGQDKGKGKATNTPAKEGILSFFGPNPTIPPRDRRRSTSPMLAKKGVGKASGKRTLADVMDHDIAAKKQKSKFFNSPTPVAKDKPQPKTLNAIAGPSCDRANKENKYILIDVDDESEVGSNFSAEAQGEVDTEMEVHLDDALRQDAVEQEEGYISPTPSCSGDLQDLSSPLRFENTPVRSQQAELFGADVVSSPSSQVKRLRRSYTNPEPVSRTRSLELPRIHTPLESLHNTGSTLNVRSAVPPSASFPGPDLRKSFIDDRSSDIDCSDDDEKHGSDSDSPFMPPTPVGYGQVQVAIDCSPRDIEELTKRENEMRERVVNNGWRQKWALPEKIEPSKLSRRETNITPMGRRTIPHPTSRLRPYPQVAPQWTSKTPITATKSKCTSTRKRLPFFESVKKVDLITPSAIDGGELKVGEEDIIFPSLGKLERFRYTT